MNNKAILYIHGKGGNAEEAQHYQQIFSKYKVFGLDYKGVTPWQNKAEIIAAYNELKKTYKKIILIANSIGAFFAMNALYNKPLTKAFFISPIVNMEKLIKDMMSWAQISEEELKEKQEIPTSFGETLSWQYLQYVRINPIIWNVPTYILYGDKDNLTDIQTINSFVNQYHADLTIIKDGEHWFHTSEQIMFLDHWLTQYI